MNKIILPNKSQGIEFPKWTTDFYENSNGSSSQEVPHPILIKGLQDEKTTLEIFKSELDPNVGVLRREGIFFGCKSDPFLPETWNFYMEVIKHCLRKEIPVMALTKHAWISQKPFPFIGTNLAVGFSLNPKDEHETGTATIKERISAMAFLHNRRTRTFANMDQITDLEYSLELIEQSTKYCDLFLLGISADETFSPAALRRFYEDVLRYKAHESKIYWNNSILDELYLSPSELVKTGRLGEYSGNNVDRDFSIFWDLYR
jgi:hypothetical protein